MICLGQVVTTTGQVVFEPPPSAHTVGLAELAHTVTVAEHSVVFGVHCVMISGQAVGALGGHSVFLAGQIVTTTGHCVSCTGGHSVALCGQEVKLAGHAVTVEGSTGHWVEITGHAVAEIGHCVGAGVVGQ